MRQNQESDGPHTVLGSDKLQMLKQTIPQVTQSSARSMQQLTQTDDGNYQFSANVLIHTLGDALAHFAMSREKVQGVQSVKLSKQLTSHSNTSGYNTMSSAN